MLPASIIKNDKKARLVIFSLSIVVFAAIVFLHKYKLNANPGFSPHVFGLASAVIYTIVCVLLLAGLFTVWNKKFLWHKRIMLTAIVLSVLFLISYILHHLFAGETIFGDINHDGILDNEEKLQAGNARLVYYFFLFTHIPLAAIILPIILFTAYRALTGEYDKHRKLVRITWPIWFYVAITGVIIFCMISIYFD